MGFFSSDSTQNVVNKHDDDVTNITDYRSGDGVLEGNLALIGNGTYGDLNVSRTDHGAVAGSIAMLGSVGSKLVNYVENQSDRVNTAAEQNQHLIKTALNTRAPFMSTQSTIMILATVGLIGLYFYKR